ncbi:MAG: hypothetical protein ACR2M4_02590 [Actinomycetota bacterium]
MTTETTPPPVMQLLQTVIHQGRELSARPRLIRDASSWWIMRARAVVGRLYGKDTPEVDFWCPKSNVEPSGLEPQARIGLRLPNIERLATLLAVSPNAAKIFIGHGRSAEWLKLQIFLSQRLVLPCDEFNIEPSAGLQTGARIESMLGAARIAVPGSHGRGSAH